MINQLRLPPFIATLATMAGLRSLAVDPEREQVDQRPLRLRTGSSAATRGGRWPIFAVVAAAASVMMGMTVLGRHLYALGGNETAARLSGLPTRRLKAVAYGLSGMLAALGGVLFTGRSGQADRRLGVTYELYAITAAVVGGCSLSGGVGSIRGTVLGLFLIQIVIKGTGHRRPRDRQHPDRGPGPRHRRRPGRRLQPALPRPGRLAMRNERGRGRDRDDRPALKPRSMTTDGRAPAPPHSGSAGRCGGSCWGSRPS